MTGREHEPPTCACGHLVYDHAGWLYDCSRCACTGPGLPGMISAEGRERAPEVVARLIGGHAVQANGEPFDTLAAYMEIAPVVLLWDDGSVTWARQVAIPDTAATAREQS